MPRAVEPERVCARSHRAAPVWQRASVAAYRNTGRMAQSDVAASSGPPAWARPTPGEPRWHVSLLVLVLIILQALLPSELTGTESLIVPLAEFLLLAIITLANPTRIDRREMWLRVLGFALIGMATVANAWALFRLVQLLVGTTGTADAPRLLVTGANVWITNVIIFALWYWEVDRGGPAARAVAPDPSPDFLFPQMSLEAEVFQEWEPRILDYLYVSYTNATAFSPTDAMPLTRGAKMAMMLQSSISLATVVLVVARAVNILH